jgi:hypothetical protein
VSGVWDNPLNIEEEMHVMDADADALSASTPSSRRRFRILVTAALVVVIAAVGALVLNSGTGSNSSAAAAEVRSAVESTLSSKTLTYAISETIQTSTADISLTGRGGCEVNTATCEYVFNMTGSKAASVLARFNPITALYDGNNFFVKFGPRFDGQLARPWISYPLPITSLRAGSSTPGANPLAGLATLARAGARVRDLGTTTVAGVTLRHFRVQISATNSALFFKKELAKLPGWLQGARSAKIEDLTENIAINSSGRIAQMSESTTATKGSVTDHVTVHETFIGYGEPVTISIPSSNQVTSISSLLSGATNG